MAVRDGSRAGASDSCDARVARARRLARKEAAEKEARWQAFRAERRRVFRDVALDTDSDDGWQEKWWQGRQVSTGSGKNVDDQPSGEGRLRSFSKSMGRGGPSVRRGQLFRLEQTAL